MASDNDPHPRWRHLLSIPGLDTERNAASKPLHVAVAVDPRLTHQPGAQHLVWLLVTLLTRSTTSVIATVGLDLADTALHPGIDPGAANGGVSFLEALKASAVRFGPAAAPVVDAKGLAEVDLVLKIGTPENQRMVGTQILQVAATGWAGAVTPGETEALPLDLTGTNPFGPYVAACLAAGQAYMYARVRDHQLTAVALNAWNLEQATSGLTAVMSSDSGAPVVELDHVLAGTGAVGTAALLSLWSYQGARGTISAIDADTRGVDDTNLNRCVPFWWTDIGSPKAEVAAERLSGRHGLVIKPTTGHAETVVDGHTHLISAVDTPEARQALQDKYPTSIVQASTSGLRLEMLRVDPTVPTACLRCFNPPRPKTPDTQIRAQVADMDDATVAAHAAAVGANEEHVREWGRVGGCGQIGDALLDRLRPSDEAAAQFSVGFISVLAGVLLAAQVVKDAVRRAGDPQGLVGHVGLVAADARFVTNLLDPVNSLAGIRRYGRDAECPSCEAIRASIWARRWGG